MSFQGQAGTYFHNRATEDADSIPEGLIRDATAQPPETHAATEAPQPSVEPQRGFTAEDLAAVAQQAARDAVAQLQQSQGTHVSRETRQHIQVGAEHPEKRLDAFGQALHHKAGPSTHGSNGDLGIDIDPQALAETSGMTFTDILQEVVQNQIGRKAHGSDLWQHAFAVTGDFSTLINNAMNKRLIGMYPMIPADWRKFTRVVNAPNYKDINVYAFDGTPQLLSTKEGAEVKYESNEGVTVKYNVETYSTGFAVTREAIINDDLGFLNRKPEEFARAAVNLESRVAYNELILNPTALGGSRVFVSANNGSSNNFGTSSDPAGNIIAGMNAMMLREDRSGNTVTGIEPTMLLVPVAKRSQAGKLMAQERYQASSIDATIPAAVSGLELVVSPWLDGLGRTNQWYLLAPVSTAPVVEMAFLSGMAGPMIERVASTSPRQLDMRVYHDLGAMAIDGYGAYRSSSTA